MRIFVLALLTCLFAAPLLAQPRTDSLAYELQRKKINQMLAQRTRKFGLYTESLSKHTGIFGLQTKKDIRRSNQILMDITETDNRIFKELKILLDYRAFEQQQVETKKSDIESSNYTFKQTITRLRQQNNRLIKQAAQTEQDYQKTRSKYIIAIIVLIITSILLLLTRKRPVKS